LRSAFDPSTFDIAHVHGTPFPTYTCAPTGKNKLDKWVSKIQKNKDPDIVKVLFFGTVWSTFVTERKLVFIWMHSRGPQHSTQRIHPFINTNIAEMHFLFFPASIFEILDVY